MQVNLKQCNQECNNCVHRYIEKHKMKKGDTFDIICQGIPKDYSVPDHLLLNSQLDGDTARTLMDPVAWAARYLDWHCLDPDGSIWKRKSEDGTLGGLPPYDEEKAKRGKSIFHRPYQAEMLRCSSKRKTFLVGRQAGKSETLVVSICYNLTTKERFAIEVIAPYQSQVDLIFSRIIELLKGSNILANSIERSTKAPNYRILLKNGSYAVGFTAGTRSGQEAGASRGQHANMIVFDEADYLSPKDIDAALAVIINHPDATVWMSSTPTGKREKFFESCNSKHYRTFHFSSKVNPNWSEELDTYFRKEFTEEGYLHEVEAEFGSQEEGVYKVKYVEAAQDRYEYDDMKPNPQWLYTIGVDWNDYKIGTTIFVVGYNPIDKIFRVVERQTITTSENTQLNAIQRIIEANRLWHPSYIYVDRGYGCVQVEVITKYGYDSIRDPNKGPNHPDSRLATIVKGYDFGGSVEVRDLFNKQKIKKPSKPFLVENAVRRFESLTIKYPASDKNFTDELLGYIVDRVSQAGAPIYKQQNVKLGDHNIDALNLALVAFTLEESEFGKPKYVSSSMTFSGRIGESENKTPVSELKNKMLPKKRALQSTEQDPRSRQQELPAANLNVSISSVGLWAWPGFERDEPKPRVRSLSEAFGEARARMNNRTGFLKRGSDRPQRKKF